MNMNSDIDSSMVVYDATQTIVPQEIPVVNTRNNSGSQTSIISILVSENPTFGISLHPHF